MRASAARAWSVAAAASWRFCLVLLLALAFTAGPGIALIAVMLGPADSVPLVLAAVLLPVSVFAHELGHSSIAALAHRAEGTPVGDLAVGTSTWFAAAVSRPVLPLRADLAVTIAGPVAGALTGVIPPAVGLVAFGQVTAITSAVSALFAAHLLALGPYSKDGQALRAALQRKDPRT